MLNLFYSIKFRMGCNKILRFYNRMLGVLVNGLMPTYYIITQTPKLSDRTNDQQASVIVSLTTFPARIDQIWLTIESLLRQTIVPMRMVLWLSIEDFPEKELSLPKSLLKLTEFGLEVKFCDDNLRPHKKSYYMAMECGGKSIITVDDDAYYHPKTIEKLVNAAKVFPNAVCCNHAHNIRVDGEQIANYNDWDNGALGIVGPSHGLLAVGLGGVLYPSKVFDKEYFNDAIIKEYCISADDIWLKFAELRNDVLVYKTEEYQKSPFTVRSTQRVALKHENKGNSKNDSVIRDLSKHYEMEIIDFL